MQSSLSSMHPRTVDMVEWQEGEDFVPVTIQPSCPTQMPCFCSAELQNVGHYVPVTEHDTLRQASRPTRVHQECKVVLRVNLCFPEPRRAGYVPNTGKVLELGRAIPLIAH